MMFLLFSINADQDRGGDFQGLTNGANGVRHPGAPDFQREMSV